MRLRVAERILKFTAEIRQLKELIPICVYCRKVRDEENYWQQVETYIQTETGSRFSHGACPDCCEQELAAFNASIGGRCAQRVVPLTSGEHRRHPLLQLQRPAGLLHKLRSLDVDAEARKCARRVAGTKDDGGVRQHSSQLLGDNARATARHHEIADDESDLWCDLREAQRFLAVASEQRLVTERGEVTLEQHAQRCIVVDDQDRGRSRVHPARQASPLVYWERPLRSSS
jgi:hypothetical protein